MNVTHQDMDLQQWEDLIEEAQQMNSQFVATVIEVVLFITFFFSVITNLLTCAVILSDVTMRTTTNYYLLNLSISDFIVTFGIPVMIRYDIRDGDDVFLTSVECKVYYFFIGLLWNNSILTLTVLAIERYMAIWHPLVLNTRPAGRRVLKVVVVLWIVAIIEALTEIGTFDLLKTRSFRGCFTIPTKQARIVNGMLALLTFVLPTIVMSTMHLLIIFRVNRNRNTIPPDTIRNHPIKRGRINKLILAITASFLVCWIPFFVLRVATFLLDWKQLLEFEDTLHCSVLGDLAVVNSWISTAINPILFSLVSTKFRAAAKELWIKIFRRKQHHAQPRNY